MRQKHVPLRSCAGCGQKVAKRGLIRIVQTPRGSVEIDLTGKQNGRGVYLCRRSSCWEAGLRKRRLEHTLRTAIPAEDRLTLVQYLEGMREGENTEESHG